MIKLWYGLLCTLSHLNRVSLMQVDSLTRIYPCGECAEHFEEIVR